MIGIKHKGNFDHIEKFFKRVKHKDIYDKLDEYGRMGVVALALNTPIDTGKTAESWGYEIRHTGSETTICWTNNNFISTGVPVVILLQYGHGTGTGGYVQGRDFINPAIRPVFDAIAEGVWKELTSS